MRGAGRPACLEPAALLGLQLKFLARTGGRDLQLQDFHGFPALAPPNHGKTQRFHQQKSRAAGAGTVPRAVPALPTPRSPSGTQRQVRHTAPRRTQRLRAAKPHPSSSQELSPAAPLPVSLQHCTAHCSSLRVQADARLCFSMRGHTLSYKGNLFRLRKLM